MALASFISKIAKTLFGDYCAYFIYASPDLRDNRSARQDGTWGIEALDAASILASEDPAIREQAFYAGSGAKTYGCFADGRMVALCAYWFGERYRKRNFWPLREDEAKLVQIVTATQFRGRGIATALIASSARDMGRQGFHRAYARIWPTNRASLKAFESAGWVRIALVVELELLGRRSRTRLCSRSRLFGCMPLPAAATADTATRRSSFMS